MRSISLRWQALPLAAVGLFLLFSVPDKIVNAQTSTGTILGTVTGSTGSAIPDAHVVVRRLETGHEQSATTDSAGGYTIPSLQIANYSVTVDRPGFKTTVPPHIELQVAQQAKIDAVLQVGQVSESVTVSSSSTPQEKSMAELFAPFAQNGDRARKEYDPDNSNNVHEVGVRLAVAEEVVAKTINAYWVAFAKTGSPSGAGRPNWPAYNAQQDVLAIFTEKGVVIRPDPLRVKLDLMEQTHQHTH